MEPNLPVHEDSAKNAAEVSSLPTTQELVSEEQNAGEVITSYLLAEVEEYRELSRLRQEATGSSLNVTMLAADLGMNEVTHDHPDKNNFLPKQFDDARAFDIVLCDGQVLRTHERAAYREQCEARRLAVSQLVLGLEHLRPSGTMIILMHKLGAPAVVEILHQFHRFSSIQLFKPTKAQAKRSSFYLIASNIQVEHPQAIAAVEKWKRTWEITTFSNNEENIAHLHRDSSWAEKILEDFGPVLVDVGKTDVWDVQAKALAEAPFIAGKAKQPQSSGQWDWGRKY